MILSQNDYKIHVTRMLVYERIKQVIFKSYILDNINNWVEVLRYIFLTFSWCSSLRVRRRCQSFSKEL